MNRPNIDFKALGLLPHEAKPVEKLTPTQIEYAHLIRERQNHIIEAQFRCDELLQFQPKLRALLTDWDFEEIAKRFEERRDPNVAENQTWHEAITTYTAATQHTDQIQQNTITKH